MCTFSDALLAAIARNEIELKGEQNIDELGSDGGGSASIGFRLPMGAYLVRLSNGGTRVYQPISTRIAPKWTDAGYKLEVDNVDGAAGDKAEAKSKEITSTKTVNGKKKIHSQIGDTLNFRVETPIPNYPEDTPNKKFGVQDHPHPGLTIKTDSITVQIEDGEKLTRDADYSTDTLDANPGSKRGKGVKIEFDDDRYKSKLAAAGKKGKKLILTYTGELNGEAPITGGTENKAQPLILNDNYDSSGKYTNLGRPDVTTIYTYGIKITKKDRKDGTKLQGAEFKLYRKGKNGAEAETEVKVKKKSAGATTDATGMYIVQSGSGGSSTIISGKDGLIQIDGLGAGTYTLEETKAPDGGYALPNKPLMIHIYDRKANDKPDGSDGSDEPDGKPDSTSKIGGKAATLGSDNRLTYDLMNKKANFRLPKTGEIGAVVFGVLGMVLVAVSVALVVGYRRRAKR